MGVKDRYTATGDPKVEEKVKEVLEYIVDEVVRRFHPESIILAGSFGRGEGSVMLEDEKLVFLSDFEISVITSKRIRKELEMLAEELSTDLNTEVGIWRNKPSKFDSYRVRKLTIKNYEWKYGSRILYGENYLEKIPEFKPEDIPLWEGIRLMFNRMAESLKYISINYMHSEPSEDEKQKLIYWTSKIILACQDALLLYINKFHHSYKTRNEIFQEVFPKYFKNLYDKLPKFLPLAVKATNCKLRPEKDSSKDVIELWFDTMGICDKVFRSVIKKDMGFTFNTYSEFQNEYLSHPNITKKYYRRRSGRPLYQNLMVVAKMWLTSKKLPSLKSLTKIKLPWIHLMYSTIPLVYFSLPRKLEVNELQLKQARSNLKLFTKIDSERDDILDEWEYIKGKVFQLWYATT